MTIEQILTERQIKRLQAGFQAFDRENKQSLSINVLEGALHFVDIIPEPEELEEMKAEIGSDTFDFYQYIAIAYHFWRGYENQEELIRSFRIFDKEGTGMVPVEKVQEILSPLKENIPEGQIEKFIAQLDPDNTGKINYSAMVRLIHPN